MPLFLPKINFNKKSTFCAPPKSQQNNKPNLGNIDNANETNGLLRIIFVSQKTMTI